MEHLLLFRGSLDRLQIDKIGIGQLHWSTANYAPLQELALWDGLVAMYEKVIILLIQVSSFQWDIELLTLKLLESCSS